MKRLTTCTLKEVLGLAVILFALGTHNALAAEDRQPAPDLIAKITPETPPPDKPAAALDKANPRIQAVMAIQKRHTPSLMTIPGVVGTATGLDDDGQPAVVVFTETALTPGLLPRQLEGTPVAVRVSGGFQAMKKPAGGPPGKGSKQEIDPTARFARPVPIGVSTGNAGECSAGTISARVTNGGNVYALSNNHVYALENTANAGSEVLQPGRYDSNCSYIASDVIGTLADYEPIDFSDTASNTIDAAIALSSSNNLGKATPADGYGTPTTATVSDFAIPLSVQKYGRTTGLTKGAVTEINAIIKVGYSAGVARFVNQLVVTSRKPFLKAGDSGSLLVTDPGRAPVGLLFAANSTGKYAIANPINLVLDRFGVSIDGE